MIEYLSNFLSKVVTATMSPIRTGFAQLSEQFLTCCAAFGSFVDHFISVTSDSTLLLMETIYFYYCTKSPENIK